MIAPCALLKMAQLPPTAAPTRAPVAAPTAAPTARKGNTAGAWLLQHGPEAAPLLPYLQAGPNNQYISLIEAAVVAKALNRPLVLPNFHAWAEDETAARMELQPIERTFEVQVRGGASSCARDRCPPPHTHT